MANEPRPVAPHEHQEWLRMRAALWPKSDYDELAGELASFFDRANNLDVLVSPREGEGLQGFIEVSIRSYVDGCITDNVGYIEGWYVDPDMRGKGVGRDLVRAAENWARERGCTEMASDTEITNLASERAHHALGYEEAERLIVFRKDL